MVSGEWAPDRGDIVWIQFNPQAGHEQAGDRREMVVSPRNYNKATGLAVMLPITTRIKKYPFEVELPPGMDTQGAILCDQVKSLDWRARKAHFKEKAPDEIVTRSLALLNALLK